MLYNDGNRVKRRLREGRPVIGAWAQAGSNITAEIMAEAGFHAVFVDLEHGPGDVMSLIGQIQAMKGLPALPIVRPPWNDFVAIKRILDAGAYGLLVPYVNTGAEAEAAVRALRYPPEGIRGAAGSVRAAGFGDNAASYFRRANDEILLMTAVETITAVNNLDEILAVDGLDGVFLGPTDLAASLGCLDDPSNPRLRAAIATVEEKVFASDKILATVASSWDDARTKFDRGYGLLTLFSDTVSLGRAAREITARFREDYPDGQQP